MDSDLRNRKTKRHDSDTAVIEQNKRSRSNSEVDGLKNELAERVETWREKVHKVGLGLPYYMGALVKGLIATTAVLRDAEVSLSIGHIVCVHPETCLCRFYAEPSYLLTKWESSWGLF